MLTYIWVNIGSDNELLPDDIMPLPQSMLTCQQSFPVAFIWEQFRKEWIFHFVFFVSYEIRGLIEKG